MKKDHLKDVRLNANNQYEYMGEIYTWEMDVHLRRRMVLSVIVGAAFEIVCGFIPNSGADGHPWVMIPFTIATIMAIILAWRLAELYVYKKGIKAYTKKQIENWYPAAAFFLGVGGVGSAIAAAVVHGSGLFVWCELMASAGGFSSYILFKALQWKKVSATSDENN